MKPIPGSGGPPARSHGHILEVARYFLKLGFTAFGGPAAHVALMHAEVVVRRKWVQEQRFLDLFGAANLIPGPTSTELAIFLGYERAGWPGLILGGLCFILPAMLIVIALAWGYVRFGGAAQVSWLFYGIKPVIIAIIVQALWGLGRKAVKGLPLALIGLGITAWYLLGGNVLLLLASGGILMLLVEVIQQGKKGSLPGFLLPLAGWGIPFEASPVAFSLPLLFLTFLKIGAVLYGSGYVLLAFLRADLVVHLGWITDRQLLDAIAIGQMTPGPVFTTATFIGYLLGGVPGAILATMGIFLPSFLFVAVSYPVFNRIRSWKGTSAFLDGVNTAALGLMAGVTWQLAGASLVDPLTLALAGGAALILFRFKINPTWLILAGALVGLGRWLLI
jgi:chromate transporter